MGPLQANPKIEGGTSGCLSLLPNPDAVLRDLLGARHFSKIGIHQTPAFVRTRQWSSSKASAPSAVPRQRTEASQSTPLRQNG
jgi:hypothetical protein